jgi:hypothetical protein
VNRFLPEPGRNLWVAGRRRRDEMPGTDMGAAAHLRPSADEYEPDPDHPEQVLEISPATGETVKGSTASLGFNPAQLTAGGGSVWVGYFDSGVLWKVVPATLGGS